MIKIFVVLSLAFTTSCQDDVFTSNPENVEKKIFGASADVAKPLPTVDQYVFTADFEGSIRPIKSDSTLCELHGAKFSLSSSAIGEALNGESPITIHQLEFSCGDLIENFDVAQLINRKLEESSPKTTAPNNTTTTEPASFKPVDGKWIETTHISSNGVDSKSGIQASRMIASPGIPLIPLPLNLDQVALKNTVFETGLVTSQVTMSDDARTQSQGTVRLSIEEINQTKIFGDHSYDHFFRFKRTVSGFDQVPANLAGPSLLLISEMDGWIGADPLMLGDINFTLLNKHLPESIRGAAAILGDLEFSLKVKEFVFHQ